MSQHETTEPPIDILEIASVRYHAALGIYSAAQCMNSSPSASIWLNEALVAVTLADRDQYAAKQFALNLAEAENGTQ
jgi:hypothetical protein